MTLRPFFSYFGGKWSLAPHYPAPEHDLIVEPFAGSAGYATRYPERDVLLVEKAPHVAELWRWLTRVSVDEVMSLPIAFDDFSELEHLPAPAATLIRFWCARGRTRLPAQKSSWMSTGRWPSSFWGELARERIAAQVSAIRHWRVVEGDYTRAPDAVATWFVDPPYYGDRHYCERVASFARLSLWCRARRGLAIVCEQNDANWLPFEPFREAKSIAKGTYREVVWIQRRDAHVVEQMELFA